MDSEEARSSLRTIQETREKVRTTTGKQPLWYSLGMALAIAVLFALGDLNLSFWAVLATTGIYLVAICILLAVVLNRAKVRPHRSDYSLLRLTSITVVLAALLIVVIVVASLLASFLYLPLRGTITGVLTAAAFLLAARLGLPPLNRWARRDPA
jgi:Ca2+/Na+ antiporter